MKTQKDVYQIVTDRIVAAMESNPGKWLREWAQLGIPLRHNGDAYKGSNVFLLWYAMSENNYKTPHFMTLNQACKLGGHVKGGQEKRGHVSVFWKPLRIKDSEKNETKTIPMIRMWYVHNVSQIDGLPDHFYEEHVNPGDPIAHAEAFAAASGVTIVSEGDQPCYVPSMDVVWQPAFSQFHSAESYYATLFHELGHATGHKSRLDRCLKGRFGEHAYAAEELIAELSAAMTCATIGIETKDSNHAAYLKSWLKMAKDDKKAIVKASTDAGNAAAWLAARYAEKQADSVMLAA